MTWFYEHYKNASAIGVHTTALIHEEQSEFQKVQVFETVAHGRLLVLDDMVMLTELDEFVYHELLSHVPLCVHHDPRRVLVVGGGDGGCVRELVKHASLERIVQCEIDERVTRVCEQFIPSVASGLHDPRVELVFEDAVAYVERNPETFDVILVDSTEPIGPAEALFREPFFRSLKRALRPGGIVTAQAESPFYAPDVLASTFADYRKVFAKVSAYVGNIPTYPGGLWTFAFASDDRLPTEVQTQRIEALGKLRYYDAVSAAGVFMAPRFVRELAGG